MVILLKRRWIFLILGIFLAVALFFMLKPTKAIETDAQISKTVVIDAGHGLPDGGAVGSCNVTEAELNLIVAKKLCKSLEEKGIKVIMTRTDENGLYDQSAQTTRQKKVADMHAREKIMNESKADLFVSIHMNKFELSKYSGPQVFFASHIEESAKIAEIIQKTMINELKPQMERVEKASDGSIYLLKKAQIPAVLIECGFLSNPEEEKLLASDAYRKKLAEAIEKGITTYFSNGGTNEKTQNPSP